MSTVRDTLSEHPKPGSFGLSIVGNSLGAFIHAGQALLGDDSDFGHAFVVTGPDEVVQSERGGARVRPLSGYLDRAPGSVVFSDRPIRDELGVIGLNPSNERYLPIFEAGMRAAVTDQAHALVGTPYNFLDYAALAMVEWGGPFVTRAVVKRMQRNDRLICSQLVDLAYLNADIHLFHDGRLPFQVTPGALDHYRLGLIS